MNRLLLSVLIPFFLQPTCSAEEIGKFISSFFNSPFSVSTVVNKHGNLSSVRIEVPTHYHYSLEEMVDAWKIQGQLGNNEVLFTGEIGIDAKHLEDFKTSLSAARGEYLQIKKMVEENRLTQLKQKSNVKFPKVFACWGGHWFSSSLNIKLKYMLSSDGKLLSVWRPNVNVTNITNRKYTDHKYIYWVFACEEDFDSLLSIFNQ